MIGCHAAYSRPATILPGLSREVFRSAYAREQTRRNLADQRLDCWRGYAEDACIDLDGGPDVDVVRVPGLVLAGENAQDAYYSDDCCDDDEDTEGEDGAQAELLLFGEMEAGWKLSSVFVWVEYERKVGSPILGITKASKAMSARMLRIAEA
jgi:hypothetical protein